MDYFQYTSGAAPAQATIQKKYPKSEKQDQVLNIVLSLLLGNESKFTLEILCALTGRSKTSLRDSLQKLHSRGLLVVKTTPKSRIICLSAGSQIAALAGICGGSQIAALAGKCDPISAQVADSNSHVCLSAGSQIAALAGICDPLPSCCIERLKSTFPQVFTHVEKSLHSMYYVYTYYILNTTYRHSAAKLDSSNLGLRKKKNTVLQQARENTMEDVKSILRIYSINSNPRKNKFFKGKSVNFLNGKFGEQIQRIIQDYGLEPTEAGIHAFMADQYWLENGLPLYAFLKTPWKWIPDQGSETLQGDSGSTEAPRYRKNDSAPPAAFQAPRNAISGPILDEPLKPDHKRLRIMRRNDGMAILAGCSSENLGKFREETDQEKFDLMTDTEVDYWFDRACEEFRRKTKRNPPVSSRRLT